jgi:hypothetical protein
MDNTSATGCSAQNKECFPTTTTTTIIIIIIIIIIIKDGM